MGWKANSSINMADVRQSVCSESCTQFKCGEFAQADELFTDTSLIFNIFAYGCMPCIFLYFAYGCMPSYHLVTMASDS